MNRNEITFFTLFLLLLPLPPLSSFLLHWFIRSSFWGAAGLLWMGGSHGGWVSAPSWPTGMSSSTASPSSASLTRAAHVLQLMNVHCHHNPQKSRVHITVHSWCCAFYGFGQMYNDVYPWYHKEYFHCPKTPLCSDYPTLSSCPECHIIGIV